MKTEQDIEVGITTSGKMIIRINDEADIKLDRAWAERLRGRIDEVVGQMSSKSEPCRVKSVPRQVIHRKILHALGESDQVAILATKQDLEDLIAALSGYEYGDRTGAVLSMDAFHARCRSLADGMRQLLNEAFPK